MIVAPVLKAIAAVTEDGPCVTFLGGTSAQKGALWWAAHHRDHHRESDGPGDVHSPVQRGFWWSHVGWFLSTRYNATRSERIRDLAPYPELRFLVVWADPNGDSVGSAHMKYSFTFFQPAL